MTFKKLSATVHLWLGLASGLVVFIVGITGCCYVFIDEIKYFTNPQPWQYAKEENRNYLLPSQIKSIVEKRLPPDREVSFVNYRAGYSTYVGVFGKDYRYGVHVNPYSGKVLHIFDFNKEDKKRTKEKHFDFFGFVLDGHLNLWLPYKIGQPIENAGVLVFLVELITGMILWWPKNLKKANADKSFKIKWKARFKRINYDLHNVLGFYVLLVAFAIAATGLVWSYGWFSDTVYWISSGGKSYPQFKGAESDTTKTGHYNITAIDSLWLLHTQNKPGIFSSASFPKENKDVIAIEVNMHPDRGYTGNRYYYDRYTLQPVKERSVFSVPYAEASVADKIARMNYDIHTGRIGGLTTKIIAFFASLICASLPVTGFYIWWGKKKKRKKSIKQLNKEKFHIQVVTKKTIQ